MKVLKIIGKVLLLLPAIPISFVVIGMIGVVAFGVLLFDNKRRNKLFGNE